MKRLDEITIADLMPDSISKDAEVSATSRAIDPQLKAISEAVDKPLILAAIDDLSEGVLEHLAVQYDVTAWNSAWPIETKQAVLKTAIADKRKMGTRGAVQRAIEAVAPIATITEWWQDTGGDMPPHTFEIDLLQEGSAVDAETQASVIAQVNEAKPVRSHFTFSVGQMLDGNVYFAGVLRSIAYARVRSAGISIEQMGIEAGILAAMRGMNIRRLLTSSHMGEMPEPTPPETHPSYIVVDSTTGIIIHSIEDEGMVYGEVGYVLMDDAAQMITVYETGVRTESFYFTTNGRNETQNTTLPVDSSIPLYWADGSRVNDSEGWASEYNGSPVLALTKADMNVFAALQNDKVISADHSGTDCLDFYGAGSTQEITIDANFGDAVSIPDGYTIQSVKSTTAYSFPTSITAIDSWNFTVKYGGKDVYSDDITSSDVCVNDLPCLYIFQYVSTSTGYRVSTTPAKYNGNITAITDVSVNSGSNDFVVMTCTAQSSAYAQDIVSHASAYPGYFEYYGSDGNIVAYFFDVPQTLWKFENDSFSWLGDTSSTSDLAYWYNSKAVRIKCVKSVSQSRSAWSALVERIFTLSFANTQLPGITITLPASETGTSGTTVTLPTMSGEYESGGKTWTPSAWDIGAFGSTYTITGDVIAHLIFEEVPSELTAYFTSAGAAGTGNTKIGGDFGWDSASLYDASGNPLAFDLTKKYTVLGMYDYSGASVEISSGSRIKDTNGFVQYMPSGIKRVFTIVLSLSPQTAINAYFTSRGANETANTWCNSSVTKTLYDSNGVPIPYDSTKTYTTVATFVVNGDTASTDFTGNYADWSDTILKGRPNGNKDCYKVVIRVE